MLFQWNNDDDPNHQNFGVPYYRPSKLESETSMGPSSAGIPTSWNYVKWHVAGRVPGKSSHGGYTGYTGYTWLHMVTELGRPKTRTPVIFVVRRVRQSGSVFLVFEYCEHDVGALSLGSSMADGRWPSITGWWWLVSMAGLWLEPETLGNGKIIPTDFHIFREVVLNQPDKIHQDSSDVHFLQIPTPCSSMFFHS